MEPSGGEQRRSVSCATLIGPAGVVERNVLDEEPQAGSGSR